MNELVGIIPKMAKQAGSFLLENSPAIWTGLAVAGVVTTFGFTVDGTIKAVRIIDEEQLYRASLSDEGTVDELDKLELVKLAWRSYIPALGMGLVTVSCIVLA